MSKVKVEILWIESDCGYGRNSEYGDTFLLLEEIGNAKVNDIIEIDWPLEGIIK